MGTSYGGGECNSDNAFDASWGVFENILESLESDAFQTDLTMRLAIGAGHVGHGLVETTGEGNLRALIDDGVLYDRCKNNGEMYSEDLDYWWALDFLTEATQLTWGRLYMLSARLRRVAREAYRCFLWHFERDPIETWERGPRPIDFDGHTLTMADVVLRQESRDEFSSWVKQSLISDEGLPQNRDNIHPLFTYGRLKAHANTIHRTVRWLNIASQMCEGAAQHVLTQETGYRTLPNDRDAGMINLDTGETDPRGFPYVRTTGKGIEPLKIQLPSLGSESFEVFELDQAVDEDHLRFEAKEDPFSRGTNSIRALALEDLTRYQPWIFQEWLGLGPRLLEKGTLFEIPEIEALEQEMTEGGE